MENSVVFSVDSGECSASEDEEDDIQRKEELRQLLSEQLHDDLLDDSVATSIDGEISVVSSLRYSLSPSERTDVVTPDIRDTNSPSTNHMLHNQSHDNHPTSPTMTATPQHTPPPAPPPNPHTHTSPSPGDHYDYHHHQHDLYTHGHALEQPQTTPPLAHQPVGDTNVPQTYDMMSSNPAAVYSQHHQYGVDLHHTDVHLPQEEIVERDVDHYGVPGHDHMVEHPSSFEQAEERSDVFAGTSQAYMYNPSTEHREYFSHQTGPSSYQPALEVVVDNHCEEEYQLRGERLDVLSPSLQQMGLRQLGVLFKARGRHIAELTQQISAQAEDNERHVGILRHEKLLLEKERDQLNTHVTEMEAMQVSLEKQVATYQGQLSAEQTRSKALDTNKKELLTRLQADEAMINSLSEQVNELTSSDTLSRVRDSYSSAIDQANHQHQQEVLHLQQQMEELREEIDKKEETISQLSQELHELQSHYEAELVTKDQELQRQMKMVAQNTRPLSSDENAGVAQQLDFGAGRCGVGVASEGAERLKELAAQVEDLTYQLSTTQEELQAALERAEQAEAVSSEQTLQLSEVEGEREQLSHHLDEIREELESFKSQVATEKKEALEQCRSACLKLHEDSTRRLRETVETEKEKSSQQYERQLSQLKSDLATVQEQYVALCNEKEKLSSKLDDMETEKRSSVQAALDKARLEWLQQQESLVREAVGVAREEWQEGAEQESRKRVELALKEQQEIWSKRLESEKSEALASAKAQFSKELAEATHRLEEERGQQGEDVRRESQGVDGETSKREEEWEREKERAVDEAVKLARAKWLEEKETSLQHRVESALGTAEKLWKEQHLGELAKLQRQLQEAKACSTHSSAPRRESGQSSGSGHVTVDAAVGLAREKWEREHQMKVEEAVGVAKQKFENELDMRVELAVTNERGKWEEQTRRAWQQREQGLLTTAHQEWSKAQEIVVKAELERSKREWEREMQKTKQDSIEEAVSHTKQHYEGLLKLVKSELLSKHEREKSNMAGEIRQLEAKVANILREQQRLSDGGRSSCRSSSFGENGRSLSQPTLSESEIQRLRPLICTAMRNVKQDMLALLHEIQEASKVRHQMELAQVREETARKMKQYYLECLHQLVNGNSRVRNNGGLGDGGHTHNCLGCDYLTEQAMTVTAQAGFENHLQQQTLSHVLQQPFLSQSNENQSTNSRGASSHNRHHTGGTTVGTSRREVLRNHNPNSPSSRSSDVRVKKAATQSEKRKSIGDGAHTTYRTQSVVSGSGPPAHSVKTSAGPGHVTAVGRCRNLDSRKRICVKGGAGRSGHPGTTVGSTLSSSSVKKDLFATKRTAVSAHLGHHGDGGRSGTRERRGTGRRLNTDK